VSVVKHALYRLLQPAIQSHVPCWAAIAIKFFLQLNRKKRYFHASSICSLPGENAAPYFSNLKRLERSSVQTGKPAGNLRGAASRGQCLVGPRMSRGSAYPATQSDSGPAQ